MLNPVEGEIFCFNKPYTMTSFRVVSKVRGILCNRLGIKNLKVGHAGTLDPLATGVLIICTGKATKQIDTLQAGTKEYIATLPLPAHQQGDGGRGAPTLCRRDQAGAAQLLCCEN